MGLTWSFNSRFAIRNWGLEGGRWKLECRREWHAETGMAGDGWSRVDLQLICTTDVNALVTICQRKNGQAERPALRTTAVQFLHPGIPPIPAAPLVEQRGAERFTSLLLEQKVANSLIFR
jgi:hypothetical protein